MTSSRPYLVRAIYDWIVDNGCTPYILVNAEAANVTVPQQHVRDGRIILNISPQAVRDLHLSNEWLMFSARFSGTSVEVSLPPQAVLAIYAKENGRGMVFGEEDEDVAPTPEPPESPEPPEPPKPGRPTLRVVK